MMKSSVSSLNGHQLEVRGQFRAFGLRQIPCALLVWKWTSKFRFLCYKGCTSTTSLKIEAHTVFHAFILDSNIEWKRSSPTVLVKAKWYPLKYKTYHYYSAVTSYHWNLIWQKQLRNIKNVRHCNLVTYTQETIIQFIVFQIACKVFCITR